MDRAFTDSNYKEARELLKSNKVIKVTFEDRTEYSVGYKKMGFNDIYRQNSRVEKEVSSIEDLRLLTKYYDRLGMKIIKIDVVE